jgi:signal transduction histidine kinase
MRNFFFSQKQTLYNFFCSSSLLLAAYLDFITGPEFSSILFYLIPIYFFANNKYSTQKTILFHGFIATVFWYYVETTTKIYTNELLAGWNALVRLTVFVSIGILIFRLKEKMHKLIQNNSLLENLNNEKNVFIGIAAHDLKNPIGTIYSFSDLLISNFNSETELETKEIIGYIKELSTNSLHILDNILDISKIESGIISIVKKDQDYISFLKKIIFYNQMVANRKEIIIQLECTEENLLFAFDENHLSEVINNLLTNAVKFSDRNANITVRITNNYTTILTEIIDKGKGIAEEEQGKLFNYFQKTSTLPTERESSSGLGLAIAKKIVTQHDGTIGVKSELGKGSNFFFQLTK